MMIACRRWIFLGVSSGIDGVGGGKKRKEKKKKKKRKKRKMGCCIGLRFGLQKWRWEVGHDGLELVLG